MTSSLCHFPEPERSDRPATTAGFPVRRASNKKTRVSSEKWFRAPYQ